MSTNLNSEWVRAELAGVALPDQRFRANLRNRLHLASNFDFKPLRGLFEHELVRSAKSH